MGRRGASACVALSATARAVSACHSWYYLCHFVLLIFYVDIFISSNLISDFHTALRLSTLAPARASSTRAAPTPPTIGRPLPPSERFMVPPLSTAQQPRDANAPSGTSLWDIDDEDDVSSAQQNSTNGEYFFLF